MWLVNDSGVKPLGAPLLCDCHSCSAFSVCWLLAWSLQCTVAFHSSRTHGREGRWRAYGENGYFFSNGDMKLLRLIHPLLPNAQIQLPINHALIAGQGHRWSCKPQSHSVGVWILRTKPEQAGRGASCKCDLQWQSCPEREQQHWAVQGTDSWFPYAVWEFN